MNKNNGVERPRTCVLQFGTFLCRSCPDNDVNWANLRLESLSTRVFEARTATGREHSACRDSGACQIFIPIISNGENILSNVNVVVWRQVKRLPFRVSKRACLSSLKLWRGREHQIMNFQFSLHPHRSYQYYSCNFDTYLPCRTTWDESRYYYNVLVAVVVVILA